MQHKELLAVQSLLRKGKNSREINISALMETTLVEAMTLINSSIGFFYIVNSSQKFIEIDLWLPADNKNIKAFKDHKTIPFSNITLWKPAVENGEDIIINLIDKIKNFGDLDHSQQPLFENQLIIPVFDHGEVVGIFGLANKKNDFTPDNLAFASVLFNSCWNIIAHNGTNRKLQQLQQKDEIFNDAIHEVVLLIQKGVCVDCNAATTKRLGYEPTEIIGKPFLNLISDDSKKIIQEHLSGDKWDSIEAEICAKDGTNCWVELSFSQAKDNNLAITITNISSWKKLLNQKKISDYNYRLLFENMNEAFALHKLIVNDQGTPIDYLYVDVNPIFEKLTGFKRELVVGRKISELIQVLEPYWLEKFGSVALTGISMQYTNYSQQFDKFFETNIYCPEKGYFAVTFVDVTHKINADKEVIRYNQRLEILLHLSQQNTSSYKQLINSVIHELVKHFDATWGAYDYYESEREAFEFSEIFPADSKIINSQLQALFNEVLSTKTTTIFERESFKLSITDKNPTINSIVIIPLMENGGVQLLLALGFANPAINNINSGQIHQLIDLIAPLLAKQRFQDQILKDKIKAELSESRFSEIQKLGKIGWYEVFLKEKLYLGSDGSHLVFFDEYLDHLLTPEQILGAVHPEDREHFIGTIQQNVELKKEEFEWEYRVITKKSGIKYVFSKVFCEYDQQGTLTRRYGIVQDITDKKKNEIELKIHNERLESLLRISQITETNINTLYQYLLNEALQLTKSITGFVFRYNQNRADFILEAYSQETIKPIQVNNFPLFTPAYKNQLIERVISKGEAYINNSISSGPTIVNQMTLSEAKIGRLLLVPLSINNDEKLWIALLNGVNEFTPTDSKQITLLMDSFWNILERQNYQKLLIEAKEKAEESDKLKSAFLANMSHEIRTPMNGIIGFSELLTYEDISAKKKSDYAKIIIESGKQLLTIIDDILDISKIEVGQIKVNTEVVSINDVFTEISKFFLIKANEKGVKLRVNKGFEDAKSVIITDRARLIQILHNLISNSYKFTTKGEISIGYVLKDSMLEFYVSDTGIGIPEHMQQLVFERFRQIENPEIQNFRGTGLGLSISEKLVNLLGGSIWLTSELGVGTTFYFTIPYHIPNPIKQKQ